MDKKPASPLKKVLIDKICRTFNLVFNQVTMYHADHPAAVRTINQFFDTLDQGLALHTPIVIIFNRDQFFFEEDAFDARINTVKMGGHFKKAEIQLCAFLSNACSLFSQGRDGIGGPLRERPPIRPGSVLRQ